MSKSNSELTVILERYKKDLITMDNAVGLIKETVYQKELLHEVTQRSILEDHLDNIYESIVGDNGRKRFTQEEFIEYLLEIYDDMKLNGEK
jgi:hypothetical protein